MLVVKTLEKWNKHAKNMPVFDVSANFWGVEAGFGNICVPHARSHDGSRNSHVEECICFAILVP